MRGKKKISKDLQTLISLLEDDSIYEKISTTICEKHMDEIDAIWTLCQGKDYDELIINRLEIAYLQMQFKLIKQEFKAWASKKSPDLLEGLCLLNKYKIPTVEVSRLYHGIDAIVQDCQHKLSIVNTPIKNTIALKSVLYDTYAFKTKKENIESYFLLNFVLADKVCHPDFATAIFLAIAQRVNIPLQAVHLGDFLILSYMNNKTNYIHSDSSIKNINFKNINFYIDTSTKGIIAKNLPLDQKYSIPKYNNNVFVITHIVRKLSEVYNDSSPESVLRYKQMIELEHMLQDYFL